MQNYNGLPRDSIPKVWLNIFQNKNQIQLIKDIKQINLTKSSSTQSRYDDLYFFLFFHFVPIQYFTNFPIIFHITTLRHWSLNSTIKLI